MSEEEPPTPTGPRYDCQLVTALERQVAEGEQDWRRLFNELGLSPIVVYYEDVAADAGADRAVRDMLSHLGVHPGPSSRCRPPDFTDRPTP